VAGGDVQTNVGLLRAVLEGETGPRRGIVLLNAAPALIAGMAAADWPSAIQVAARSIDSGAARETLEGLIRASHDS
jgi:anthranilate phosphoribosyltransferase